jgi:hypothetical protein
MQPALFAERLEVALFMSSRVLSGALVTAHCLRRGASHAVSDAFLVGAALLGVPSALAVPEVIEPVFGVAGSGLIVIAHLLRLAATKAAKARCRHIRDLPSWLKVPRLGLSGRRMVGFAL